jgi:hypothetical protein
MSSGSGAAPVKRLTRSSTPSRRAARRRELRPKFVMLEGQVFSRRRTTRKIYSGEQSKYY